VIPSNWTGSRANARQPINRGGRIAYLTETWRMAA
jgi:hypothetical protein